MQKAIVGGLSNIWHGLNIAGETIISYLTYHYINKKDKSTNTENIITHITGVDFNALYSSAYSFIPNEMIGYTGNKMLMPGNFKEYIKNKQRMLDIINEKKELFVVILKEIFLKNIGSNSLTILPLLEILKLETVGPKRNKQKKHSL
jgi:hypothetical protein